MAVFHNTGGVTGDSARIACRADDFAVNSQVFNGPVFIKVTDKPGARGRLGNVKPAYCVALSVKGALICGGRGQAERGPLVKLARGCVHIPVYRNIPGEPGGSRQTGVFAKPHKLVRRADQVRAVRIFFRFGISLPVPDIEFRHFDRKAHRRIGARHGEAAGDCGVIFSLDGVAIPSGRQQITTVALLPNRHIPGFHSDLRDRGCLLRRNAEAHGGGSHPLQCDRL